MAFFAADSPVRHVACTPAGALALCTEGGLVHFVDVPVSGQGDVGDGGAVHWLCLAIF